MSIRFYALNQVYTASITGSFENAQFPVLNIADDRRTKVFRTTAASGDIVLDFGGSVEIDSFMIVPHSSDGWGISNLTLELNATNEWSSPAVTQSIALDQLFEVGKHEFSTVQTYRFARLVFDSTLSYCEIANFFIGKRIELVDNDFTYPLQYKQNTRRNESINRFGQKFIDEINTQKKFSGSIETMTKDEFDQILEMLDFNSTTRPIFINVESTAMLNDMDRVNGMYYISSDPDTSYVVGNYWNIGLSFDEAL
jgi:hypothetical protein